MKNKKFIYKINKKDDEINFYYNLRKIFIENLKPTNNKELNLYEMYSNIFINIIFLKCRYEDKTEEKLNSFLKKNNFKKILSKNNFEILNKQK